MLLRQITTFNVKENNKILFTSSMIKQESLKESVRELIYEQPVSNLHKETIKEESYKASAELAEMSFITKPSAHR